MNFSGPCCDVQRRQFFQIFEFQTLDKGDQPAVNRLGTLTESRQLGLQTIYVIIMGRLYE